MKKEGGSPKKLDEASLAEHNKPNDGDGHQERERRNREGYED